VCSGSPSAKSNRQSSWVSSAALIVQSQAVGWKFGARHCYCGPMEDPRAASPDRTELWSSLLVRLTNEFPGWATWKNVDSAMAGKGDVDSLAPPSDWPEIRKTFEKWAAERRYAPIVVCRHVPQGPHFVTFEPGSPYIVQLDVKERATFRGSTLVDAWSLQRLAEMDPRGYRRVRPGADGVIRLCSNAIGPGGRLNASALMLKRIPELLRSDPEGVEAMAELFGPARLALLAGVRAVLAGSWNRRAMLQVEAWALARSVAEPTVMVSRLWFGRVTLKRCPVLRIIREHDRRVPDDLEAWLDEVRVSHEIVMPGALAGR